MKNNIKSQTPESVNANVGWFTVISTGIFLFLGQDPDSADTLVRDISTGKYTAALAVLIPSVVTPIQKILNKKQFSFDFIKSWNFRIQIASALLLLAEYQAYKGMDSFLVSILDIIGGEGRGFLFTFLLQLMNTGGRTLKGYLRGLQA